MHAAFRLPRQLVATLLPPRAALTVDVVVVVEDKGSSSPQRPARISPSRLRPDLAITSLPCRNSPLPRRRRRRRGWVFRVAMAAPRHRPKTHCWLLSPWSPSMLRLNYRRWVFLDLPSPSPISCRSAASPSVGHVAVGEDDGSMDGSGSATARLPDCSVPSALCRHSSRHRRRKKPSPDGSHGCRP
ncbi:hypothetical protein ACLOJK_011705 [Asimina triloba]